MANNLPNNSVDAKDGAGSTVTLPTFSNAAYAGEVPAYVQIDPLSGVAVNTEADKGAARAVIVPRGDGYCVSANIPFIQVGIGANTTIFSMRSNPLSNRIVFIDRVRLGWVTTTAFTALATAGRRLCLFRGAGATPSSGTAVGVVKKLSSSPASGVIDVRHVTSALGSGLAVTGVTYEADPIATMSLTHVGAANAFTESIFEFGVNESHELMLLPGEILAIRPPQVMDAGGLWQLTVNIQWREAAAY